MAGSQTASVNDLALQGRPPFKKTIPLFDNATILSGISICLIIAYFVSISGGIEKITDNPDLFTSLVKSASGPLMLYLTYQLHIRYTRHYIEDRIDLNKPLKYRKSKINRFIDKFGIFSLLTSITTVSLIFLNNGEKVVNEQLLLYLSTFFSLTWVVLTLTRMTIKESIERIKVKTIEIALFSVLAMTYTLSL